MHLHGKNILGGVTRADAEAKTFQAVDPARNENLEPLFYEATEAEVNQALVQAEAAFEVYRQQPAENVAAFLNAIADEIHTLGEALIDRLVAETGLGKERLIGERGRTMNQLRMFADLVREGSWVEATIDRAQPDRKPLPKPDLRRMLIPIGPVVVFGASNFPLAFSVAGGDTASALAAGNPVVVKAHPSHPGASELVAQAINRALEKTNMPPGVFSLLHGASHEVSLALVRHPATKAVGFTGSQRAGRALFDAASQRPSPIPVYAEMGSINPVFVLPEVLHERLDSFVEGLISSMTLGVGQFCTSPGVVVGLGEKMTNLVATMNQLVQQTASGTMLNSGILQGYEAGVEKLGSTPGVSMQKAKAAPDARQTEASAVVFATDAPTFLAQPQLSDEVFGPATLLVSCSSPSEMEQIARNLEGHLTATIHGTESDFEHYKNLISLLEQRVGRVVFNGFPTGVEVCASMHHGGPYPATTDVRSTSVGTAAIKRFARPVCYQNSPQSLLPLELRNENPKNMWRLVNNEWTKESGW